MKFIEPRRYAKPEAAGKRLLEIASLLIWINVGVLVCAHWQMVQLVKEI